jgi:glutathione S-transferase
MPDAQPKIALYGHSDTPFTEKCRRGLIFKGLDFELHCAQGPDDVQRWSPVTRLLPVMTVDGELVSDSTHILLRLDEIRRDPPLLSPDPSIAAQQRNLEDWADESFLWYWQEWFRLEAEAARPAAGLWARLWQRLRPRPDEARKRAMAELVQGLDDRLGDLVNLLGTRQFFHADRPSLADLTVHAMLLSLRGDAIPSTARMLAARPTLVDFMRRIEQVTGGSP